MAQTYAFGDNEVHGTACPVRSVGDDVEGKALFVAEQFDQVVQDETGFGEGALPEDWAAYLWGRTIDRLQARIRTERDPEHCDYLKDCKRYAEKVQERAF